MVWVLTDKPVRLMEAAPEATVTGLPNAVPSTLNFTVPVGAARSLAGHAPLNCPHRAKTGKNGPQMQALRVILNVGQAASRYRTTAPCCCCLPGIDQHQRKIRPLVGPANGLKMTPIWHGSGLNSECYPPDLFSGQLVVVGSMEKIALVHCR